MADDMIGEQAQFNQAKFEMERLYELMLRIDRCNIDPTGYNYEMNMYNYEIIFNDLSSVFFLISSKLKETEEKDIIKIKDLLSDCFELLPVWNFYSEENFGNKKDFKKLNKQNWARIKCLLDKFRLQLEELMNTHKIGNPSKEDPRRAIVSN